MLRVPTDKQGEIVALKCFQPKATHVEFLNDLIRRCDSDNDLRNLPLSCLYEQGPNNPGKDGHIALYRIIPERRMIRHLNPEGW